MLKWFLAGAVSLALSAVAVPALAQTYRPERPYRGLFGSGSVDSGKQVTVHGNLSGGYDDDLEANATGSQTGGSIGSRGGGFGSADGAITFTMTAGDFSFGATADHVVRYYPSIEDNQFVQGSQGRVTVAGKIRKDTSIAVGSSVTYQPFGFSSVFPVAFDPNLGDSTLQDPNVIVTSEQYLATDTDFSITHQLTRRASLSGDYGFRVAGYTDRSGHFGYQTGAGLFRYNVGRGVDLRAGYTYARATYSELTEPVPNHSIDAGVDYSKALSFSRRTHLSFSTGTSATRYLDSLRFRVTGNARLEHESGRTWVQSIAYARQVELNETWVQPVLYDAVTGVVSGLLSRRLEFVATANAALGTIGLAKDAGTFDSYYATSGLMFAVSRHMGLRLDYAIYKHRFDESVLLPFEALHAQKRQTVSVGLQMWAPLYQRARRN